MGFFDWLQDRARKPQPTGTSFSRRTFNPNAQRGVQPLVNDRVNPELRNRLQGQLQSPLQAGAQGFVDSTQDQLKSIVRSPIRSAGAISLSLNKADTMVPKTRMQKIILGSDPIKPIQKAIPDNAKVLEKYGVNPKLAKGLAGAAFVAGTVSDLVPGIGGKGTVAKNLAKEMSEQGVRNIAKKQGLNLADDAIKLIAKETDPKKITSLINPPKAKLPGKDKTAEALGLPEQATKTTTAQDAVRREQLTGEALNRRNAELLTAANRNKKKVAEITASDSEVSANTALLKAEDKRDFHSIFDRWIAKGEVAKTTGAQRTAESAVPSNVAQQTIRDIESGAANKYGDNIRTAYDDLYKQAQELGKKTGQDVPYRQNYLTHVWKETPEQMQEIFKRAGKKFSFANAREIPTYEEGIKMGLTPRFDNPGQMVGEYARKLEQTKANVEFFTELKDNGYIVPASVGHRTPGFVPVNAEGFPLNTTSIDGERVTGQWFAPKNIADEINKVFNPPAGGKIDKTLDITAKVSSKAQDILLSGGIPKTPINAFTVAQTTKEVLGGRIKSPIISMIRSLDGGASQKFFQDNVETIKKMQERNIPFSSEFSIDNAVDRGWVKNTFGSTFGEVWSKTVNTPTFKRFMPMLQVNLFNDIERAALKAGKSAGEAADVAGDAVRNFYGLGNTGKAARSSKLGKDLVSTVLFAPRYRESMLNFWINNVKTFTKNPLALENRTNATFMVGATAMLLGMNQMNKAINGHSMSENPDGKTDKLLIPIGGGKTLGIPFLSSIATLPRTAYNTGKAVAEGDFKEAGKQLRSNLSVGLRPITDVMSNENYFGSEIYDVNDTTGGKIKSAANYLLNPVTGAYTHPYLREGTKFAQGKQGIAETLSKATELPIRWYNTKSIENAPFWKEYENQKKLKDLMEQAKYGKISQGAVEKQLSKISGKSTVSDGTIIESDNYVAYKTSEGISFADTKEEAQFEINKDKFKKSDKNIAEIDGIVFTKTKDGKIKDFTKPEFDSKIRTQQLEIYRERKNYTEWTKTAKVQLDYLLKEYEVADPLTQLELQNKIIDLQDNIAKFASYGGFTKPKKGRRIQATAPKTNKTKKISLTQPSRGIKQPKITISSNLKGGSSGTRSRIKTLRTKRMA